MTETRTLDSWRDIPSLTIDSLYTASSATLSLSASDTESIHSDPDAIPRWSLLRHAREVIDEMPATVRSALIESIRTRNRNAMSVKELFSVLIELASIQRYGQVVHEQAVALIFLLMSPNAVDALVSILLGLPTDNIRSFFLDLAPDERASWTAPCRLRLFQALLAAITTAEPPLEDAHVQALFTLYDCDALHTLLSCSEKRDSAAAVLAHVHAAYKDGACLRPQSVYSTRFRPETVLTASHPVSAYVGSVDDGGRLRRLAASGRGLWRTLTSILLCR